MLLHHLRDVRPDITACFRQILLERTFRERRNLLRTRFTALRPGEPGTAHLAHVNSCESAQGRECIEAFWQDAVESSCEGLMIKVGSQLTHCLGMLSFLCQLLDNAENSESTTPHRGKTRKRPLPATYEPGKYAVHLLEAT